MYPHNPGKRAAQRRDYTAGAAGTHSSPKRLRRASRPRSQGGCASASLREKKTRSAGKRLQRTDSRPPSSRNTVISSVAAPRCGATKLPGRPAPDAEENRMQACLAPSGAKPTVEPFFARFHDIRRPGPVLRRSGFAGQARRPPAPGNALCGTRGSFVSRLFRESFSQHCARLLRHAVHFHGFAGTA